MILELRPEDDGGGGERFLSYSHEQSLRGRGPGQRELKSVLSDCSLESYLGTGAIESH